jgi:hypothetical protein
VIETLTTGPMILLGTNSSPVTRVIDPVMETLTTGPMIPSGTNSPPIARVIDPVIETSVSITGSITLATGGLLVP